MTILFESAIRVTLIAAIIGLVLFAMRIKTASVLHAVWASVVVLMMLLPAWVAWGPKAPLPVLPPERSPAIELLPPPSPAGLAETAPRTSRVREDEGYASLDPIAAIYLLGLGVLLFRLVVGTVRASRLESCVAPITVGILHPRIVLPKGAKDWPQAQLDAVLAHEGEHIRRRDPLFQWLALLNRALFWFHPLAWWLERKLSGLAEEACDAAVIAQGHDPRKYSEYLLDLARSVQQAGTRIDAVGMAMPGIGLKHRIRQMLSGVPVPKISRPRMACTVSVCAAAAAILAAGTLVRAQGPQLAFEVASIKPMPEGSTFLAGISISGDRVTVSGPLKHMMTSAYGVQDYQISTGPSWADQDLFEITAKAEGPGNLSADRARQMLRTLLGDRFQLKLHREKRELPVYALVIDKNGTKLNKSTDDTKFDLTFTTGPRSRIVATMPMTSFVYQLSHLAVRERPVIDRTGLSGRYDFTLEWTPIGTAAEVANGPSLFTAVQEQLGLKLEPQRALVEFLVIDHVEKPSEN